MNALNSLVSRIFFFIAFVIIVAALVERFVNFFGYTFLRGQYTAGRMLEFAAVLLVFVIALLLRQIREGQKKGAT